MHSSFNRKEKGMLIKLDMANAFDRVKLSFLYQILNSFGFNFDFINMIKACTNKPWIAPLVNGRPAHFFQASQGLRQGYPLSPFLYILMADSLSRKLTVEKNVGTITGIKSVSAVDSINHALFADDTLLLGGASFNEIGKNFQRNYAGFLYCLKCPNQQPEEHCVWMECNSRKYCKYFSAS